MGKEDPDHGPGDWDDDDDDTTGDIHNNNDPMLWMHTLP